MIQFRRGVAAFMFFAPAALPVVAQNESEVNVPASGDE